MGKNTRCLEKNSRLLKVLDRHGWWRRTPTWEEKPDGSKRNLFFRLTCTHNDVGGGDTNPFLL